MDAEVGVIGVGTMGSMAMWQLAKRSISVIGFEQFGIGHDRSAAGGESRLFRTAYMEGEEYVPLLQQAHRQWRQLEEETGNQLLTLNGGLMIGDPNLEVMRNVCQCIETFSLDHEIFDEHQAKKHYPQHRLFPGEIMILDKTAGFLRPELAVVSAVQRAEALGAKIYRYSKVEEILPDSNGVTIIANGKKYRVAQVVVTAGPWTGKLFPELKDQIKARRLVLTWFTPKDISKFKPESFPIFAHMRNGFRLTGAPTLDGSMVKASNTRDPEIVQEPENLNRGVTVEEITKVSEIVEELIPDLIPNPVRATVYMDGYTPDDHSIVGRMPSLQNIILLSGFSGHGFKMAPVMGEVAADLILEGKTKYPVNHLSPNRFSNEFSVRSKLNKPWANWR